MQHASKSHREITFQLGDVVLLIDQKSRRYLVTLREGKEFHSHAGLIRHDDLVGLEEGVRVMSTHHSPYLVLRPTLSDFVLEMPRGAQVIYPKDIGPLLMIADITPGCHVFESGVGSGALSMAMLRAGANITGYELREDFATRARLNVERFLGEQALERYAVELRNSYDGIEEGPFDRMVLDLPEPWNVVPHAPAVLRRGAIIASYSPSIIQVMQFRQALDAHGFAMVSTTEVLNRGWYFKDAAVRPDHRMVAHTGFLTAARFVG